MNSAINVDSTAELGEVMACSNHGYPLISEEAIDMGQFSRVFLAEIDPEKVQISKESLLLLPSTKRTVSSI